MGSYLCFNKTMLFFFKILLALLPPSCPPGYYDFSLFFACKSLLIHLVYPLPSRIIYP